MRWYWRHTLVARVVWAVVLAVGLAGVAVTAKGFWDIKRDIAQNAGLVQYGRALVPALSGLKTPHDVVVAIDALETQLNASRAARIDLGLKPCLFQVWDASGHTVYASNGLGRNALADVPDQMAEQYIGGQAYWVVQANAAPWTVRVAEPVVRDATWLLWIIRDLLPTLLLCLPVVLLPIWLAVRQGLKPLHQLVAQLLTRSSDDLSPLVSDLKYAELTAVTSAFNPLLDQLRRRLEREQALLQDAAHELRTPLAVMAAQAHLLVQADSAVERQHAEAALQLDIERTGHLAEQLLALAVIDAPRQRPLQQHDVAELLREWLAAMAPTAFARNIDVVLQAPDQLPCVLDVLALQSMVHNLVDNALRYVPLGSRILVDLQSDVCAHSPQTCLRLRVADNGPGIPVEEQGRVFERFVRGSDRQSTGSGLGLAIARQAARALHGQLTLGPGLDGVGVGFTLVFPDGR